MYREHIVDTQNLNRAKNNNTLYSCSYKKNGRTSLWSVPVAEPT